MLMILPITNSADNSTTFISVYLLKQSLNVSEDLKIKSEMIETFERESKEYESVILSLLE